MVFTVLFFFFSEKCLDKYLLQELMNFIQHPLPYQLRCLDINNLAVIDLVVNENLNHARCYGRIFS